MIQRLQSLWLLLAAIFTFLTFSLPFYGGTLTGEENMVFLDASYNFITIILTALLAVGSVIIIFLFKNRKLQLRLTIVALIIAILNIVIYFNLIRKFTNRNLSFSAILYFVIPILLFLAARGIWKDKKLVKDLDRLR